jgi:hypothetical protein
VQRSFGCSSPARHRAASMASTRRYVARRHFATPRARAVFPTPGRPPNTRHRRVRSVPDPGSEPRMTARPMARAGSSGSSNTRTSSPGRPSPLRNRRDRFSLLRWLKWRSSPATKSGLRVDQSPAAAQSGRAGVCLRSAPTSVEPRKVTLQTSQLDQSQTLVARLRRRTVPPTSEVLRCQD